MTAPRPRDTSRFVGVERAALVFADRVSARVAERVPYLPAVTRAAVQQHALWAHADAGLDLEESVIFRRDVIALAVESLPMRSQASLGRRRSVLTRVGESLGVLEPPNPPLSKSEPSRPYSSEEVHALRGWVSDQRGDRNTDARALLALGLGAGLLPRELCRVTADDVEQTGDCVVVYADRRAVRVQPMWAVMLDGPIERSDGGAALFQPGVRVYKNKIGDFTRRSVGTRLRPVAQRMRATWLVERMTGGMPVQDLVHEAGVASLAALARFEQFLPPSSLGVGRRANA